MIPKSLTILKKPLINRTGNKRLICSEAVAMVLRLLDVVDLSKKLGKDEDFIRPQEIYNYFDKIWNNLEGINYTLEYESYGDDSFLKNLRYRFQEASGASTFWIAPPGFEPGSFGPEPKILDHCTKGL